VTPIDDVSVVFPGGTCGLIGPNGAGKTTFFNVLSGFVKPAAGSIAPSARTCWKMADYRRARWGLRRTFQTEMAIEQLSVYDNVAMIHEHSGAKRASRRADVLGAIEFVGLDRSPKAKVGKLGARERRLVEVARAVVGSRAWCCSTSRRPACPTRRPAQLGAVIQKIPEQFGALVILVDHDMSLVSGCCETTAVLDFGKLIASGPTAEVLRNEHVMRAYLGTTEESCERRGREPASSKPSRRPRGGRTGRARRHAGDPARRR
jgi:branched-chain amino acid transport system ATP-binding protein